MPALDVRVFPRHPRVLYNCIVLCVAALLSCTCVDALQKVPIDFAVSPCPQIIGCRCGDRPKEELHCQGIGSETLISISAHYPSIKRLFIREWDADAVDLALFGQLRQLEVLSITQSGLEHIQWQQVVANAQLSISTLMLDHNRLENLTELCEVRRDAPKLNVLSLTHNYFDELDANCAASLDISVINFSQNWIRHVPTFSGSVRFLNVSNNRVDTVDSPSAKLEALFLSFNPIEHALDLSTALSLRHLDVGHTLTTLQPLLAKTNSLQELRVDSTPLLFLDVDALGSRLNSLFLANTKSLVAIAGTLPPTVNSFTLTNSKVQSLPPDFFRRPTSSKVLKSTILAGNEFNCTTCALLWTIPIRGLTNDAAVGCPIGRVAPSDCGSFGIIGGPNQAYRTQTGASAVLPCYAWTKENASNLVVQWWLFRPSHFIGNYSRVEGPLTNWTNDMHYRVLPGGALLIRNADRSLVERHLCAAHLKGSEESATWLVSKFRLDYSFWYGFSVMRSVFWGCNAGALIACFISFVLNIVWIVSRNTILWWIRRAERIARVRQMVEAIEKYRSRQMNTLSEHYQRRVNTIRDNYHSQMEQLREAYVSQASRLRDYRTAQMEAVSAHVDTIRENYADQMRRVREYGRTRADQLVHSYERQVNRMRTFTLQQRLRLMRQYKVKQRYLNKLLENFTDVHNPEELRKHEDEVMAVLNMPTLEEDADELHEVWKEQSGQSALSGAPDRSGLGGTGPEQDDDDDNQPGPSTSTALTSRSALPPFSLPHHLESDSWSMIGARSPARTHNPPGRANGEEEPLEKRVQHQRSSSFLSLQDETLLASGVDQANRKSHG